MNERNINEFLLDTIVGLSGDFCKNLRAVEVDVKDNMLITWFYFDGEITEKNKKFASDVTSNSTYVFTKRYDSKSYLERVDYPIRIPNNGRLAYLRYEELPPLKKIYNFIWYKLNTLLNVFNHAYEFLPTQEITYNFLGHPVKKLLNAFNEAEDVNISEVFWQPLIVLLLQEAFLGCIKPNVRAVKGEFNDLEKILYIWVYFDGNISKKDHYIMNLAIANIKAYFKNYFSVKSFIDRLDRPQEIPHIGTTIFHGNDSKEDDEQNVSLGILSRDFFYFKRNIQDALLGKIGPALRSVKIEIDEMRKVLYFWFYYDGKISERDRLNAESVVKYISNRYNDKFSSNNKIIRLDCPNRIPFIGWSVYKRDEQN